MQTLPHFGDIFGEKVTSYEKVYRSFFEATTKGVPFIPVRYEDLANPQAFPTLLEELGIPFSPAMLNWKLSKNYQPGKFSFEYIHSVNNDDKCFDWLAHSNEFLVKLPSEEPSFVPDSQLAREAKFEIAQLIYESIPTYPNARFCPAVTSKRGLVHCNHGRRQGQLLELTA